MKGRTDVDDVMAIKPNFLTSTGYHPHARSSAIISLVLFKASLHSKHFHGVLFDVLTGQKI